MASPRIRSFVGATQLLVGALVVVGVWAGLPARWWPVDVVGTALGAVGAASGVGLLVGARWSLTVARAAAWTVLVGGCTCVTLLALAVGHLWGLYGAVGSGGALLMGTIAALVVPYLVGLPLLWLMRLRDVGTTHSGS